MCIRDRSPAIEMSTGEGFVKVMPSAVGFGLGALFIFGMDKVLPHLHINFKEEDAGSFYDVIYG